MKVLVACEESQAVCKAFRERGHEAYSCDIIDCSGGHPEWHIRQNVLDILNPVLFSGWGKTAVVGIKFKTTDGKEHFIEGKWDMIIAPPCTRLCNSGQRWLYWGTKEYREQKKKEQEYAVWFFMQFVNADCEKIVIENPSGIMSTLYRKPDCTYNPYDFDGETDQEQCKCMKQEQCPLFNYTEISQTKKLNTQKTGTNGRGCGKDLLVSKRTLKKVQAI